MRAIIASVIILVSFVVLETARAGVEISQSFVGETPVTRYAQPGSEGPVVIVAHGFAGSQQMMQGYALPLARAGYDVRVFEFLGHGRHPVPMSGDVSAIEGTTRLLMAQTSAVIDAAGAERVALLGHSMATDVLVRVSREREDVATLVLISAFSKAVTADSPKDMLLITGAWEPGLREFARAAVGQVGGDAVEGETVVRGDITRRAAVAPFSEHVSVLQSRVGRAEAVAWMDRVFDRNSDLRVLPTGWAILGLLAGLVVLYTWTTRVLPRQDASSVCLNRTRFAVVLCVPMIAAPILAVSLNLEMLPVLVADYLLLHLLIFGGLQLGLLRVYGARMGAFSVQGFGLLLLGCVLFGAALDRYAANFWPTSERLWIIAVLLAGAVPYMVSDALLTTDAPLWRRIALRAGFLVSLAIAVALDFEGLFFLMMIAPVLVLFYLVFGTMGRATSRRSGPLGTGLALGVVLAWALGVSFPLFQA